MDKKILCPTCRKPTLFDPSNRYRPFCSERCSILDLGAWADERYAIPSQVSEISSVNKNPETSDLDYDPSSQPPPKHRLN